MVDLELDENLTQNDSGDQNHNDSFQLVTSKTRRKQNKRITDKISYITKI